MISRSRLMLPRVVFLCSLLTCTCLAFLSQLNSVSTGAAGTGNTPAAALPEDGVFVNWAHGRARVTGNAQIAGQKPFGSLTCPAPLSINQTDATSMTMTFQWEPPPDFTPVGYQIDWNPGEASHPAPFVGNVTTGTIPLFGALTPNRFYDVHIRTDCGGGMLSDPVGPVIGQVRPNSSSCDKPVPSVVPFANYAVMNWPIFDGARDYQIVLRNTRTNEERTEIGRPPYFLRNLDESTPYLVTVQTICGLMTTFNSMISDAVEFTTTEKPPPPAPPCLAPAPDQPIYNAVQSRVSWTPARQDPLYQYVQFVVTYRKASEDDSKFRFVSSVAGGHFFALVKDLDPTTSYRVKIATECSVGYAQSPYSEAPDVFTDFRTKQCPIPAPLPSPSVTYSTAKVKWTADDSDQYPFVVQYKQSSAVETEWQGVTTGVGITKMTLGDPTPLVPATSYDYRVLTQCDFNHASVPSVTDHFTTLPCPVPERKTMYVLGTTRTSADLAWEPVAESNDLRYRKNCPGCSDTIAPWQEQPNLTGGVTTINGLAAMTRYEFQVRGKCPWVSPTVWSPSQTFDTQDCSAATPDVSVTHIDKHSAIIQWPKLKGAVYYQYHYREADGDWSPIFDVFDNSEMLTELARCTDYVVEVRTSCAPVGTPGDHFSLWTKRRFTTDGCTCENPMVRHGTGCSVWFIGVDQGSQGWEERWATQVRQDGHWRFHWQECPKGICTGEPNTINDYAFRRDKACDTHRHVDYYVDGVPLVLGNTYLLDAQYRCDNGVWSDPVGELYDIVLVDNFKVSNLSATSATLTWDPLPEATGYVISVGSQDSEPQAEQTVDRGTTKVVLDRLDPNTAYDFAVAPILADGSGIPALQSVSTASGNCRLGISPTSASAEAGESRGRISVSANDKCEWSATSDVEWITITSGSQGSGSGTVEYSVAANPETDARTGTVTIGESPVIINQRGTAPPNAGPYISSISPDSAIAGSGPLVLTVNGAGFTGNSVVQVNGSNRSTVLQNPNVLTASLPASDLINPFTLVVTVVNPDAGGGVSNAVNFVVTSPTGCTRNSPTVTMSPSDQQGYRGQHLSYQVTVANNDSPPCNMTTFYVSPSLPASGWGQSPDSMTFSVMPGESLSRNVEIWSAPTAPYAPHVIREITTSSWGHSGSGQATYTVYSIAPPDTCGHANPTVSISPSDQRGWGGQQLTYRVFVTNNDNPQCGPSGITVTPALPDNGWGQVPSSMGFVVLPGETVWRDAIIWSAPGAPFASHVFAETATSDAEKSGTGQATYTVYDPLPPDTCGRANPTVTISPDNQSGTQAQRLSYRVTVTNNDAPGCNPSLFTVRPTLPTVPSGYPWTHVPEGYFTIFAVPGESASRDVEVISAALAQMGDNTIVWTASHTRYNSGTGRAIFNVVPYGASPWKFLDAGSAETSQSQWPWYLKGDQPWGLDWLFTGSSPSGDSRWHN